ncbi:MAG: hypothetical protein PHQ18_04835 [Patescibacteria group bacterium]|nr:hypothetical protein [Patescibacteria group bacterium]
MEQTKNSKVKKCILWLFILLIVGLNFYFYWRAVRWENILTEDWSNIPELSNLSAILEYFKALVKIVIVDGLAIVGWLYLRGDTKK